MSLCARLPVQITMKNESPVLMVLQLWSLHCPGWDWVAWILRSGGVVVVSFWWWTSRGVCLGWTSQLRPELKCLCSEVICHWRGFPHLGVGRCVCKGKSRLSAVFLPLCAAGCLHVYRRETDVVFRKRGPLLHCLHHKTFRLSKWGHVSSTNISATQLTTQPLLKWRVEFKRHVSEVLCSLSLLNQKEKQRQCTVLLCLQLLHWKFWKSSVETQSKLLNVQREVFIFSLNQTITTENNYNLKMKPVLNETVWCRKQWEVVVIWMFFQRLVC